MITDTLHTIFDSKDTQRMLQNMRNIESDRINECACAHTRALLQQH